MLQICFFVIFYAAQYYINTHNFARPIVMAMDNY